MGTARFWRMTNSSFRVRRRRDIDRRSKRDGEAIQTAKPRTESVAWLVAHVGALGGINIQE